MAPNGGVRMPDGYVRLLKSDLAAISIHHVLSAVDLSIDIPEAFDRLVHDTMMTGYTEWVGRWRDAEITVGWDWGVLGNGIVMLNPTQIRTNLQIVAASGEDEERPAALTHVNEWLESLPWRDAVKAVIEQNG